MTKVQERKIAVITLLAVMIVSIAFSFALPFNVAYASDKVYSGVLDDLKKDSMFDTKNYPVVSNDYSLKIIQLAESVDNELFVYVYQPCGKSEMRASSINLSTTAYADITPDNYKLKYINSNGVFFKYVVDGVTVSNAEARYYGVTSIFRSFNKDYGDKDAEHGNTVSEVPFGVGKEYRFSTVNGNPVAATVDIETIEITDKFVGLVRYPDGFAFWSKGACDSHFVAFDTDKPIDKLVEADVAWVQQTYWNDMEGALHPGITWGEKEKKNKTLSESDDTVHYTGGGLFAGSYSWDRIQSTDEFVASVDLEQTVYSGAVIDVKAASKLTDEGKQALKNKKWVLRFAETEYEYTRVNDYIGNTVVARYDRERCTFVGDVTILRLKFITNGVTYNLGVIDNKQTGSNKPINDTDIDIVLNKNGKWIIAIVLLILLLILLGATGVLPMIVKGVCWLISLPFRLIGKGFKALSEKRKEKKKEW